LILTVTLNPALDHTLFVDGLKPHDTNRVTRTETDAGGKGLNLSRVAHELGSETLAICPLGGPAGHSIEGRLRREGVSLELVEIKGITRTNFSVEDGSGEPPTTFNGAGPEFAPEEWAAFMGAFEKALARAKFLAMGGSLPPGRAASTYAELAGQARARGVEVLVDADGEAMKLAMSVPPDIIKPNRREAERLLDRTLEDESSVIEAARELSERLSAAGSARAWALISLGEEGAALASPRGVWFGEPIAVEAKSTIGSGDSMLAGVLHAIEQGEEAALSLGLACGAATAETDGSEIARRAAIERLLPLARVREI